MCNPHSFHPIEVRFEHLIHGCGGPSYIGNADTHDWIFNRTSFLMTECFTVSYRSSTFTQAADPHPVHWILPIFDPPHSLPPLAVVFLPVSRRCVVWEVKGPPVPISTFQHVDNVPTVELAPSWVVFFAHSGHLHAVDVGGRTHCTSKVPTWVAGRLTGCFRHLVLIVPFLIPHRG